MSNPSNLDDLIDRYFAMWNEADGTRRRALIAEVWADRPIYIDPMQRGDGRDGIHAMVQSVHDNFPGLKVRRAGPIDGHNGWVRFPWTLGPDGGPAVADGIDVGVVVDGKLESITGFFDHAPAMAEV